jgi:ABC-type Fe3+/spermidine/putrescine transport system ATPase subunit
MLAGIPGLVPGTRATVILRPEAVSLAPAAADSVRLRGTLIDTQYLGPQTTYEISLHGGGTFLAAGNGLAPGLTSVGREVGVTWMDDAAWVVADAPAEGADAGPSQD